MHGAGSVKMAKMKSETFFQTCYLFFNPLMHNAPKWLDAL